MKRRKPVKATVGKDRNTIKPLNARYDELLQLRKVVERLTIEQKGSSALSSTHSAQQDLHDIRSLPFNTVAFPFRK